MALPSSVFLGGSQQDGNQSALHIHQWDEVCGVHAGHSGRWYGESEGRCFPRVSRWRRGTA